MYRKYKRKKVVVNNERCYTQGMSPTSSNRKIILLLVVITILLISSWFVSQWVAVSRQARLFTRQDSVGSSAVGPVMRSNMAFQGSAGQAEIAQDMMYEAGDQDFMPRPVEPAPTDTQPRLVIRDTGLSLLVEDVPVTVENIKQSAEQLGGFLVSSHVSKPEESASGQITVRVPSDRQDEALASFKNLAIRVVSENVNGRDVTDQYVDLEARLEVLNETKAKFEAILDQADEVNELLQVQRELTNLQAQIDNVRGQQQYLEQSAELTAITVYLSTDELALPYAPDEVWRPQVVFKLAVRSLISSLRAVGDGLIWLGVFAPLWLPILLLAWWWSRRR